MTYIRGSTHLSLNLEVKDKISFSIIIRIALLQFYLDKDPAFKFDNNGLDSRYQHVYTVFFFYAIIARPKQWSSSTL